MFEKKLDAMFLFAYFVNKKILLRFDSDSINTILCITIYIRGLIE